MNRYFSIDRAQDFLDAVMSVFDKFPDDAPPEDDVTLMVIKIEGTDSSLSRIKL